MKKFELTDEHVEVLGKTLYRIRALKDFGNVKAGEPISDSAKCLMMPVHMGIPRYMGMLRY